MPLNSVKVLAAALAITLAAGLFGCASTDSASADKAEAAAARAEAAAARAEAAATKTQQAADQTTAAADRAAAAAAAATRSVNASSDRVDQLIAEQDARENRAAHRKTSKHPKAKPAPSTASSSDAGKDGSSATDVSSPR